jgi:hypothetical protein
LLVQVQGSSDPAAIVIGISPSGVVQKNSIITLTTQAPTTPPPSSPPVTPSTSASALGGQDTGSVGTAVATRPLPGKGTGRGG